MTLHLLRNAANSYVNGMVLLLDFGAKLISGGKYESSIGNAALCRAVIAKPKSRLERIAMEAGGWTAAALNLTIAAPASYILYDLLTPYLRH